MTTQHTARLSLPYPELTDTADVPRDVESLAAALDDTVATDDQGVIASRPTSSGGTPGVRGRYYFATDEGVLYRDRGTQWDAVAAVGADTTNPPGNIITYIGVTAPSGWLLCDGSIYTTATYPALGAVIGSRFTLEADAAGTFRVPDLRGRGTIGAGTGTGLTARTLGAAGGTETHTLTSGQTPAHTHSGTTAGESSHTHTITVTGDGSHSHTASSGNDSPDHTHSYLVGIQGTAKFTNDNTGTRVSDDTNTGYATGGASERHTHPITVAGAGTHAHAATAGPGTSHTHTYTTDTGTGAGQAHPNMQPYLVATYLVRT